jgi:L-rhamnose mutarotase
MSAPQRVCFTLRVRSERVDEYAARHAAVWPQMRAALTAAGWRNYSIFMQDGTVIGYLECDDFAACVARMQDQPVNARWQAEMAEFFDLEGAGAADLAMSPLPEIFHLD